MNLRSWLIAMERDHRMSAHAQLFFALNRDEQDWSSREGNRLVQFVELQGRIIARVNQKPLHIPNIPYEVTIKNGMTLQLKVRMMRNKTSNHPPYNKREMPDTEIHQDLVARLGKKGFLAESVRLTPGYSVWFERPGGIRVHNPSVEAVIEGTVQDCKGVADMWYHGIGKLRTYGFGMLRETVL